MQPETGPSRALLTIIGIAIVVVVAGAIWYMTGQKADDSEFPIATSTPRNESQIVAQSESIVLYAPRENARIGTPLIIEGEAKIYEDTVHTVHFRLLDASGKEIASGYAVADSTEFGQYDDFRGELNFISETDQEGTLEVYRLVREDGSEIDKVTIPVMITTTPEFIKA